MLGLGLRLQRSGALSPRPVSREGCFKLCVAAHEGGYGEGALSKGVG